MTVQRGSVLFPIRLSPRLRPILFLFGVRGGNAWVRLEPDRLLARFGFSHAEIPLADVERWDVVGPYRWWRAVGIRQTLGKPDISYAGASHGGVRLRLKRKHRIAWVNATDFYVSVDDLEAFARALEARGIPGSDLRRTR